MIEIIEVFVAHGDGGERSIGPVIGICDTKENAAIVSKGRAFYGADGVVMTRKAVRDTETDKVYLLDMSMNIPVTINEDIPDQRKRIKEEALKKLSVVEIDVLGIKR